MRERAPSHGLFAVAFDVANEVVGERTEEFDHGFVLVAVFVSADVHTWTDENGVGTGTILREQAVEERNDGGIAKIEVVGTEFFRAERGTIVRKCQRVGGDVDLGENFHALGGGFALESTEFFLRIATVARSKAGEEVAFETESGGRLRPIVAEVLLEAVIVEVYLQSVHLIIGHHFDQLAQIVHGDVFATDIDHETTHRIGGAVGGDPTRQGMRAGLFADLQNGARTPKRALGCGGGNRCGFSYGEAITFGTEGVAAIGARQNEVTGAAFALHDAESARKKFGVVGSKAFGHRQEGTIGHYDAAGGMEITTRALPRSEFGHDEGTRVADCRGSICANGNKQRHEGQRPKLNALIKVHDLWMLRI